MRVDEYLRERLKRKRICLMTHIIVGYPSFEANLKALEIMAENDVDVVEIQMPFSEPIADGPIFVRANQMSLQRGTTVDQYFRFMEKATARFDFPLLMMGYYNPVFKMGEANFLDRLQSSGGRGFIIPDLPIEEGRNLFDRAKQKGLAAIPLMTPSSTEQRLKELGKAGSGFVYVVARKGVTGEHTKFE
ncbi:MAG: tryptophan synthase subunit alpha, partial [candidate division KSB1 bacterium]|nr:tryptophan synthase subunit alpha [candidate division KSB1 bacterium]